MRTKALKDSMYIFHGKHFLEFIDVENFKEQACIALGLPKCKNNMLFEDFYSSLIKDYPNDDRIGKAMFENILYSHLKNIFVDQLSSIPNTAVDFFKKNVKQVIEDCNFNTYVPVNYREFMSVNGFYLMDVLNITVPNVSFIAGYDFTEEAGLVTCARFLFVEVNISKDGKTRYFISGIEIDYKNKIVLTMIKNINNLAKDNLETDTTVNQLHNKIKLKILMKLGVSLYDPNVETDRKGMYVFCKKLDNQLLKEIRETVDTRTDVVVKNSVDTFNNSLFNNDDSMTTATKRDLEKKIKSLLISCYIENNFKSKDLIRKAKDIHLPGYPTRIKFTSSKSGKSSTQSNNANQPISLSDMFHSLYFSFEQALGLDTWSISWFTDFKFQNEKNTHVVQTTIYSTQKQFRIVFLPKNPLNEEIIHYVVNSINSYRWPEVKY